MKATNKDDNGGPKAPITLPMHDFARPRGSTIATYKEKNVTSHERQVTAAPDEVPWAESMAALKLSSIQPSEVTSFVLCSFIA
jgi:hypothetical protein